MIGSKWGKRGKYRKGDSQNKQERGSKRDSQNEADIVEMTLMTLKITCRILSARTPVGLIDNAGFNAKTDRKQE